MLLRRHFSVTRIITCFHFYGVWLQRVPVCWVLQFLLILRSFLLLWLKREQEIDKDVLSLPLPFFFEIIQVTPKPAPCLQVLPMRTCPFSGMPHISPLLSTNLHELLPPFTASPLKQNAVCHIQHTVPAALRLSAHLSCTPPSQASLLIGKLPQEAPEGLPRLTWHPWPGKCHQHSAVRGGWHAPAHQRQAPYMCSLFWEAREAYSQKTDIFFRTMKSLPGTQPLHSQAKVVWTLPWALPQGPPAMRLLLLSQSSSRPHRETIHGLSLQKSYISSYSKTSVLVLQIRNLLVAF